MRSGGDGLDFLSGLAKLIPVVGPLVSTGMNIDNIQSPEAAFLGMAAGMGSAAAGGMAGAGASGMGAGTPSNISQAASGSYSLPSPTAGVVEPLSLGVSNPGTSALSSLPQTVGSALSPLSGGGNGSGGGGSLMEFLKEYMGKKHKMEMFNQITSIASPIVKGLIQFATRDEPTDMTPVAKAIARGAGTQMPSGLNRSPAADLQVARANAIARLAGRR